MAGSQKVSLMTSLGNGSDHDLGHYAPVPSDDPAAVEEGAAAVAHVDEPDLSAGAGGSDLRDRLLDEWKRGHFTLIPDDNPLLDTWDVVLILTLLFTATLTPFEVAYYSQTAVPRQLFIADALMNLVFLLDIFVTFNVAYVTTNSSSLDSVDHYERRPIMIARRYLDVPFVRGMNYGWFWPDILTILPWDIISGGVASIRLLRVLKLLRMLRLMRVVKMLDRWHYSLGLAYSTINLAGIMFLTITSIHWFACLWGAVAMGAQGHRESWLTTYIHNSYWYDGDDGDLGRLEESVFFVYNLAVYFVATTITSVGFGDVVPEGSIEVCIASASMCLSGFLWAYVIAGITGIITKYDAAKSHFQQMTDDLNAVMEERSLASGMRLRIRRHICESYKVYRQRHQQQTIASLSEGLRGDIAIASGLDQVVGCIWYLRDIDRDVLVELVNFFLPAIYSPHEFIIDKEAVCVILMGTCGYKGRVLARHSVIGEDMILHTEALKDNVYPRTISFVQVMKLNRRDLRHVCLMFPGLAHRIRKAQVRLAVFRGFISFARQVKKEGSSATFSSLLTAQKNIPKPFDLEDPLDEVTYKLDMVNDGFREKLDDLEKKLGLLGTHERQLPSAPESGPSQVPSESISIVIGALGEAMEQRFREADADRQGLFERLLTSLAPASQHRGLVPETEDSSSMPPTSFSQPVLEQLARIEQVSASRDASIQEQLHRMEQQQAALASQLGLFAARGSCRATVEEQRPPPDLEELALRIEAAGEKLSGALGDQVYRIEIVEQRLAEQARRFDLAAHAERDSTSSAQHPEKAPPFHEEQDLQLCVEAERESFKTALKIHSAVLANAVSSELEQLGTKLQQRVEMQLQALNSAIDYAFGLQSDKRLSPVQPRRLDPARLRHAEAPVPEGTGFGSRLSGQGHEQWLKRNGTVEDVWHTEPLPERREAPTSPATAERVLSMDACSTQDVPQRRHTTAVASAMSIGINYSSAERLNRLGACLTLQEHQL